MFPLATLRLIIVAVIIAGIGGGLWYVSNLKENLAISRENVAKLTTAVSEQQGVIAQLQEEQARIRRISNELSEKVRRQNKDVDDLRGRFNQSANGEPRDFAVMANKEPERVQRAVNRATRNAARCIEIASGAPLTESEKNATKSDEINRECPSLANPNYKPPISN